MKCLSVCQPFADLIISGKKTIELRVWNTSFRGNFLVHSPLKVRTADCARLGIDKRLLVTGAIVGMVELYDVKKYDSPHSLEVDADFHHAGKDHPVKAFGFMLKNSKAFRVPIPYSGQLGFFEANLPKAGSVDDSRIVSEIIDEGYRYQWVGRH